MRIPWPAHPTVDIRRFLLRGVTATLVSTLAAGNAAADRFAKAYASSDKRQLTASAQRYEHGDGVRADVGRAIQLYCKAARQGDADAQYRLGWIYANGRGGIKRDDGLAAAWFRLAAKQNHAQSRNLLQLMPSGPKRRANCPTTRSYRAAAPSAPHAAKPEVVRLALAIAPEYGLDPDLVLAVIEVESNYNPHARSPKNAQGLMQLIPETAERFGVRDVWNPEQNLRGGMAYLRWLLDHFDGDVRLALAGYNAGEAAVRRYGDVPPYAETQAYVARIVHGLAK